MTLTIFDIPEVTDGVSDLITQKDCARCCRVSKTWFSIFTPRLWRTLCISSMLSGKSAVEREEIFRGIRRHSNYLRSLSVELMVDLESLGGGFTRLTALYFRTQLPPTFEYVAPLRVVIERNTGLRILHVTLKDRNSGDRLQEMATAICSLRLLQELSLEYTGPLYNGKTCVSVIGQALHRIMTDCPHLRVIAIRVPQSALEHLLPRRNHVPVLSATNVQLLLLRGFIDLETTISATMRCPNLQNLELPFGTMDIEGTGNIFRDMLSKCPDVESLDIEACRFEKASTLETMIASFPKLRHVSLSVSHWQTAVQAVIDYHSRSLESVRICPGYLVHDRGIIYNLLAVCPNLRVFSATSPITAGAFLDLKVVSTKLRTLTMGLVLEMNALNLPNPDPMDFGMVRDRISRGQDAVFAKILEMQELEELVFVGRHPRTSEGLIVPFSSDKAILQLKTMKHMKRVSFYGSSQEW